MIRLLLLVTVGAMSGCVAVQSTPSDALRAHCEARWVARCRQLQRCGWIITTLDCAVVPSTLDCSEPLEQARLDAGVVTFDAAAATACIEALTERACDANPAKPVSACQAVLAVVGGRPGARCGLCGDGAECDRPGPTSCGTCVARQPFRFPQLGEPCFSPLVDGPGCDDGLACSVTCEPFKVQGEACDVGQCRPGLQCSAQVCVPFGDVNEACEPPSRSCKGGLWCDAGRCVPNPEPGEPCPDGTCSQHPGQGEACDGLCATADLRCLDATCVEAKARGEGCQADNECVSWRCVDGRCWDLALDCR